MKYLIISLALLLATCQEIGDRVLLSSTDSLSLVEYGLQCAAKIAPIPAFNCAEGIEALVTVDEIIPGQYTPDMDCDRPALLDYGDNSDGQCIPGSMALILANTESVQISAFCRKKFIRNPSENLFDEIDIIAHSVTSGSTCWFHAEGSGRENPLDGTRVPSPSELVTPAPYPAPEEFWWSPEHTATKGCGNCHDNDPFYYSPYIAQTNTLLSDPFGKYVNDIGEPFTAWKPNKMVIRGNTCMGCHRIGSSFTCGTGTSQSIGLETPRRSTWAQAWPNSHWMPVDNAMSRVLWDQVYSASIQQIQTCCTANSEGDPLPRYCGIVPLNH